jgi:LPS export ABC transporter permease LptF/LPS export ABC transporter permease LptG
MRIVDRYICKELAAPFAIGLSIFTFLLLVDKIFDLTDLIINKGVPVHLVLLLLTYIMPAFLVLTIPMGFLLAILIAFGRLSADMEIVALKACGVSPLRLLQPVLAFGLLTTAVTAYLMIDAVPRANYAFKALLFQILQSQASVGIKERVFNDTFGNFVIYVDEIAPDQVALRHVFVADERKPDEQRMITAQQGRLLSDEVNRRVTLRLLDGAIHESSPQDLRKYRQVSFRLYDITLVLSNPLAEQANAPKGDREMTMTELRQNVATALKTGGNANPYLVELHKKYAIPAACLVFALLGVPLGIRAHRGGRWAAFVVVLPIFLFYFIALSIGETLGDAGRLPPWLAMWGANIVVTALAMYLLWGAVKERPLPLVAALGELAWRAWAGLQRRGRGPAGAPRAAGPRGTVAARRARPPRAAVRRRAFNLVDRYLSREFASIFGYGVALATVVVIVGDLMTTVERYMRTRPPLIYVLEHFLYRTPPFVYQGLHLVVLMSTILLFLGLSRSNELTALKAGGVSLYRVSLPIFGLVALVTLGGLAFQETLLPVLNQKAVEVDEAKIKRRTLPHLRKRTQVWFRSRESQSADSRIFHIELVDPASSLMSGVSILDLDGGFRLRSRWDAKAMEWSERDETWVLQQGVRREFAELRPDRVEAFDRRSVRLAERLQDFAQIPKAPDVMNYVELRDYIRRLQEGGHKVSKYLVDLYAKIAFPFAALIMALVGIPFALTSPRGGRLIGVGLCLVLGLGYFVVHSAAVALARTDILPPVVAAWAANFLFGTLGLFLFLRART